MAFVADSQAPELVDPREGALGHPAVFAKAPAAFDDPLDWDLSCRPLFAAMDGESTEARHRSICPAKSNWSNMCRWMRSRGPASCYARNRRQHVIPEQPATSKGSSFQGIAVHRTKRMPISASREPTGGRP